MLRGINVSSFDDWMAQASRQGDQTLGLSTMFVPLFRVERIFLDEAVGEVESYRQRFQRRVGHAGRAVSAALQAEDGEESGEVPSLRPHNRPGRRRRDKVTDTGRTGTDRDEVIVACKGL